MNAAVEVPLTKGYVALVDAEDAERVLAWRWYAIDSSIDRPYAYGHPGSYPRRGAGMGRNKRGGRTPAVAMHRWLMKAPDGLDVDHINGDSLDNRKANLRICTRSQNLANSKKKRGASLFKGVSLCKATGKWRADIHVNYKRVNLGRFLTEEAAHAAYADAAKLHFGEFARAA